MRMREMRYEGMRGVRRMREMRYEGMRGMRRG